MVRFGRFERIKRNRADNFDRKKKSEKINFAHYRAAFIRNGIDPRAIDTMSLYQIFSMLKELEKLTGKKQVTDEEWEQADELIRSVTLNDPKVRL